MIACSLGVVSSGIRRVRSASVLLLPVVLLVILVEPAAAAPRSYSSTSSTTSTTATTSTTVTTTTTVPPTTTLTCSDVESTALTDEQGNPVSEIPVEERVGDELEVFHLNGSSGGCRWNANYTACEKTPDAKCENDTSDNDLIVTRDCVAERMMSNGIFINFCYCKCTGVELREEVPGPGFN